MAIKNTMELKKFLLSSLDGVVDGTIDYPKAKAICNLSQQVYNVVKMEHNAYQLGVKNGISAVPAVDFGVSE